MKELNKDITMRDKILFGKYRPKIYEFMQRYPKYKAHGYAVSDERDDYRISIEGVEKGEPHESIKEFQDYMDVFRFSDTFDYHTMFCWFD